MRISKRLKEICELVKPGLGVADVGADHGLVDKYLLDNEISNYVVAIENKIGPYTILKNALEGYNARVSLSDGIEDIDENVKILIIAGMGGINIVNILEAHKEKLNQISQIIVDPHRDIDLVKQTTEKLGFNIEVEKKITDGKKNYTIISFVKRS